MKAVIYIHGKDGTSEEAKHFEDLFPEYKVFGFDYKVQSPWNAGEEFRKYYRMILREFDFIVISL